MKKAFLLFICVTLIIGFFSVAHAQKQVRLIMATGGTAGTYYPFGGAMAKIWNTAIPEVNVTAQTSGASAENVRLVNKKECELAIVQSDTIDFAYYAKETFKERLTDMRAIAVLYPEVIHVVVRGDVPVTSFTQLKGLKVGVGAPGSGTEAVFRQLMDIYKMKKEDFKPQYLSFAESAEQFKDKHIDAFMVVSGIPNTAVMDVATTHSIRIISHPEDKVTELTKKYPFLSPFTIPANTYKNQAADVKTVCVSAVLIATSSLSEDIVYKLTKALFENQNKLAEAHAKGKELDIKRAATG
ncbi:MAG: TAXI family TRAP transporter solute-binding subunit, partial [Syntrophorhabdaceae bacterium]|nr:TAXI family TRAP transporter solute-binding subunit [Syntrophorhabdaceae bacterium]